MLTRENEEAFNKKENVILLAISNKSYCSKLNEKSLLKVAHLKLEATDIKFID